MTRPFEHLTAFYSTHIREAWRVLAERKAGEFHPGIFLTIYLPLSGSRFRLPAYSRAFMVGIHAAPLLWWLSTAYIKTQN
jgi:hypothetical protein